MLKTPPFIGIGWGTKKRVAYFRCIELKAVWKAITVVYKMRYFSICNKISFVPCIELPSHVFTNNMNSKNNTKNNSSRFGFEKNATKKGFNLLFSTYLLYNTFCKPLLSSFVFKKKGYLRLNNFLSLFQIRRF